MKKIINNQFFRFIVVSGINTVFGLFVFSLLIFFGLHYTIAIFFSTIIGVLFNFQTIGRLVFANHDNSLIFKFILVYCFVYLFNAIGVGMLIHFYINTYIAGAVMVVPVGIFSFLLNKKLVFNLND
jgi:putative flippase GtrA